MAGGVAAGAAGAAAAATAATAAAATAAGVAASMVNIGRREGAPRRKRIVYQAWLPDGNSQIIRLYAFGPSGLKD